MKLRLETVQDPCWEEQGIRTPRFNVKTMREETKKKPRWIHFGAGNIFRAFPAAVLQQLLEDGDCAEGLIVAEGFDAEIIEKVYHPCDDLSLLATMRHDGQVDLRVIASVAQGLTMTPGSDDYRCLEEYFRAESLQMVSFTITEKGYRLTDTSGKWLPDIEEDFRRGPNGADSYMGRVAALCRVRYQAGKLPVALVSMDNFSHNGDHLRDSVQTFARQWQERGLVEPGFLDYLQDETKVTFPWTMIDKITPRPDDAVKQKLSEAGAEGMDPIVTEKFTYIAPFVNAEECQYLVIEDAFPAGRPPLEKGRGILMADRETVDKVERMKVCTCLNPLHTALAVFGCLLSYEKISEEMNDPALRKLVYDIGYKEGLPVVTDPGILHPEDFIREVLEMRLPNPYIPDTPQRIATDTSQKLPIRFGETIKAYQADPNRTVSELKLIPLVFAGWCRYLMGINDKGEAFEVSPDPLYAQWKPLFDQIHLGDAGPFAEILRPLLANSDIFGVDLWEAGLADQVVSDFTEMTAGPGAVRKTLETCVGV